MKSLDDMDLQGILADQTKSLEDGHKEESLDQVDIRKEDIYKESTAGRTRLIQNKAAEYLASNYKLCSTKSGSKNIYYIYKNGFWNNIADNEVRKIIQDNLEDGFTDNIVRSILKLLTDLIFKREEDFKADDDLINLNNGTYNLRTYEFRSHSEDDMLIYKNSYDYDPDAKCPQFEEALEKYSQPRRGGGKDEEWINLFWEILGFCLTGGYEYNKMFWFYGARGGNGKSTLLKVFSQLVGEFYSKSNLETDKLSSNFYKTSLIGKRLAIAGDLPTKLFNIATIKELTGGDRQSTDRKFDTMVEFTNAAKFVFAMNKLPSFPEDVNFEPIKRRLIILPFDYQIKERNKKIDEIFRKELPGIFNKAIEGLQRLRSKGRFSDCKRGTKLLDMYAKELNMLEAFCNECIEENEESFVISCDLWDEYENFMIENAAMNWKFQDEYIRSKRKLTMEIRNRFDITEVEKVNCQTHSGKRGGYQKLHGIKLRRD